GEVLRQNFERNVPSQPRIASPIHLAHPARAKQRDDLVGPDFGASRKTHLQSVLYATRFATVAHALLRAVSRLFSTRLFCAPGDRASERGCRRGSVDRLTPAAEFV